MIGALKISKEVTRYRDPPRKYGRRSQNVAQLPPIAGEGLAEEIALLWRKIEFEGNVELVRT